MGLFKINKLENYRKYCMPFPSKWK